MFLQGKICVKGKGRKSFAKYFLSEFSVLKINPRHKNYISSYIWHRSFIQTVKCSFLDEKIKLFIKVFYDAPFTFSFTSRKRSVFRTRQQDACEMFICRKGSEHLVEKKLSLVVFYSNCSFKMVKCSFFNQIIVYQSFYGAPLAFNYVLLQGKFLCFWHASASHLWDVCLIRRFEDLVEKIISPVIFDTNRSFKR